MNEEMLPEDFGGHATEDDINETKKHSQLQGTEETIPDWISEELTKEIDEFLYSGEIESEEELNRILQKLDVPIAINGNKKAKELRALLLEKYKS